MTVEGPFYDTRDSVLAITGGTGAYANARGQMELKSLAGGNLMKCGANVTPAEAIRYAMSLPISTLVSGMKSLDEFEQNLAVARSFTPLTAEERADLLARSAPAAEEGVHERFKTTREFDANEGRVAHNHPLMSAAD